MALALQELQASLLGFTGTATVVTLFTPAATNSDTTQTGAGLIESNQKSFAKLLTDLGTRTIDSSGPTAAPTSGSDWSGTAYAHVHAAYADNGPANQPAA